MTAYVRQATAVSSQRAMEVFERLNSLVNLVIGAANTVAGKTMFDAIERVRKTPYYRFTLKRHLREAERAYYAYEKLHIQNFGDARNSSMAILTPLRKTYSRMSTSCASP